MAHLHSEIGEYAIILNDKNEVLLVKLTEEQQWHFPGGRLEECEDSVDALKREVMEETGLKVVDAKPVFTKCFGESRSKYKVFFLTKVKEPYKISLCHEHDAFMWCSKQALSDVDFVFPFYKEMLEKIMP